MERVLLPRAAGVLSAVGLAISEVRRDESQAFLAPVDAAPAAELEAAFARLEARAAAGLEAPALARAADLRYARQSFELTVDAAGAAPRELAERFQAAHEERAGYRMDGEPVEIVALRVVATVPVAAPAPATAPRRGSARSDAPAERPVRFAPGWVRCAVHAGEALAPGDDLPGPCVVEMPEATCLVAPGWAARVDDAGALLMERGA